MKKINLTLLLISVLQLFVFQMPGKWKEGDVFGTRVFIENKGQFDTELKTGEKILYAYTHENVKVYFTESGPVYKLTRNYPLKEWEMEKMERGEPFRRKPSKNYYVSQDWIGANKHPVVLTGNPQSHYITYGDSSMLTRTYKKLLYKNIYDHIDIEYIIPEDKAQGLKYTIIVHPGGEVDKISMTYTGDLKKLELKHNELLIKTPLDDFKEYSPVSFSGTNRLPTYFQLHKGIVSYHVAEAYDKTKDLVIDPWVSNITTLATSNDAYDVDYDLLGNTYVYGGSSGALVSPFMIAKYNAAGILVWTFSGVVTTPSWSSVGLVSNFVVNKFTGKCYTNQNNVNNMTVNPQIIRLDVNGFYDNFMVPSQANINEIWEYGFNCSNGEVYAFGAGVYNSNPGGIIDQINPATSSLTSIALTGSIGCCADVVCSAIDDQGNGFIYLNQGIFNVPFPFNPANNRIMRINSAYTGTVWGQPSTYTLLGEALNKGNYISIQTVSGSTLNASGNSYNCLAVNSNYLYFYDGINLAAYDKSNGNKVGFTTVALTQTLQAQGGIAVDDCDNVYLGANNGTLLSYHFNGVSFSALPSVNLGVTTANKYVYDIKYDRRTNLLHVCGSGFAGTFAAANSLTCMPFALTTSVVCLGNNNGTAITTVSPGIANAVYSFTYVSATQTVATFSNVIVPSNTITNLPNGTYTVFAHINDPCGPVLSNTFSVNCTCGGNATAMASTSCTPGGNSFSLTASGVSGFTGTPTYTWSGPGGFSSNQANPVFFNGQYGTYTLSVSSGTCVVSSTVNAQIPSTFTPVLVTSSLTCANSLNGSSTVSLITGTSTPPYTYSWTSVPVQTTQNATLLPVGVYTCFVTDAKGCTYSATTSVIAPSALSLSIIPSTLQACAGSSITLTGQPSGGTPPYTYLWSNGSTSGITYVTSLTSGTSVYTLTVLDANQCSVTHTQSLTFFPSPTISITGGTVCAGGSLTLTASGALTYSWSPPNSLSSSSGSLVIANPAATTVYSVTGLNSYSCAHTASTGVSVIPLPNLVVQASSQKICKGNSVNITASGATSYSWSPSATLSSGYLPLVTATPTANTIYTVIGYNVSGTLTCPEVKKEISIQVIPQVTPSVINSASVCVGGSTPLYASGGSSYVWNPATGLSNALIANPNAHPLATTIYTVHVSNAGQCGNTATVIVYVNPTPTVYAGENKTYNLDEEMIIKAVGEGELTWIYGEGIYCKDCPTTFVYPKRSGCYIVQAVNKYNCKATDEVCIDVTTEYSIYVPNSFTPNGDGLNDVFNVYGTGIIRLKLLVYDRWGEKIFESNDQSKGWDGSYKNSLCEQGVYTYVINYTTLDRKALEKSGHINLIR